MEQARLIIQFLPQLAPAELHREVWQACEARSWRFGSQSTADAGVPFWNMDLTDSVPVTALWAHARPRCEELAGRPLRVTRQYANGHTYGQGGTPHRDDSRVGSYTLLYYPMLDWRPEWEGETMFIDERGEVVAALRPEPNRAVFFDARILHYGRAPARLYGGLRVTIAFKLEAA